MPHIARSIELDEPAGALYDYWTRFEELPRYHIPDIEAGVRWRAEVLTFEPKESRTRVTLRIDYDMAQSVAALSGRVEAALESFRRYVEERAVACRRAARR